MAQNGQLHAIQRSVWKARLPLEIRLAASECRSFDQADPYLVSVSPSSHPLVVVSSQDANRLEWRNLITVPLTDRFPSTFLLAFVAPASTRLFPKLTDSRPRDRVAVCWLFYVRQRPPEVAFTIGASIRYIRLVHARCWS